MMRSYFGKQEGDFEVEVWGLVARVEGKEEEDRDGEGSGRGSGAGGGGGWEKCVVC